MSAATCLNKLDLSKDAMLQLEFLQEDLLLIQYADHNVALGLGWLPAYKPDGRFVLSVVKAQDWENPVFEIEFRDIRDLIKNINNGIEICCKN